MSEIIKSVLFRFLRGGIAGAVSAMLAVSPKIIENFNDLQIWLTALTLAGFVGFVSGSLLAIDKAVRIK